MLETPLGNESLNASLFGEIPAQGGLRTPSFNDSGTASLPSFPTQQEHSDLGISSQTRDTSFTMRRSSTLGPGTIPNRNSALVQPAKKRPSAASSASPGRLYKVLGDLFLLAGRTMDATIWQVHLTLSKAVINR